MNLKQFAELHGRSEEEVKSGLQATGQKTHSQKNIEDIAALEANLGIPVGATEANSEGSQATEDATQTATTGDVTSDADAERIAFEKEKAEFAREKADAEARLKDEEERIKAEMKINALANRATPQTDPNVDPRQARREVETQLAETAGTPRPGVLGVPGNGKKIWLVDIKRGLPAGTYSAYGHDSSDALKEIVKAHGLKDASRLVHVNHRVGEVKKVQG